MIQLISRNQRAVSPEVQPRVIKLSDCEINVVSYPKTVDNEFIS